MKTPEYGAMNGTYRDWDEGDLIASQAQQASMAAQRNFGRGSVDTHYDDAPSTWAEATPAQREILAAVEQGILTDEEGMLALDELAKS